jgi:hypothetical protein
MSSQTLPADLLNNSIFSLVNLSPTASFEAFENKIKELEENPNVNKVMLYDTKKVLLNNADDNIAIRIYGAFFGVHTKVGSLYIHENSTKGGHDIGMNAVNEYLQKKDDLVKAQLEMDNFMKRFYTINDLLNKYVDENDKEIKELSNKKRSAFPPKYEEALKDPKVPEAPNVPEVPKDPKVPEAPKVDEVDEVAKPASPSPSWANEVLGANDENANEVHGTNNKKPDTVVDTDNEEDNNEIVNAFFPTPAEVAGKENRARTPVAPGINFSDAVKKNAVPPTPKKFDGPIVMPTQAPAPAPAPVPASAPVAPFVDSEEDPELKAAIEQSNKMAEEDKFHEVKVKNQHDSEYSCNMRDCPRGAMECPYKDCSLGWHHPESDPTMYLTPCNKGDACLHYKSNNCMFGHAKPKMCFNGNKCTYMACAFNHPCDL